MKKILLLFIVILAIMPATQVNATHVFVGVKIARASAPGSDNGSKTDSNWCLPRWTRISLYGAGCSAINGGADLSADANGQCVRITAVQSSNTSNDPYIVFPACANGNTIWSGLLDLTTSTNYAIQLTTPSFCPGELYGDECWVAGENQSCSQICDNYGLEKITDNGSCINNDLSDCSMAQTLMGATCANCFVQDIYQPDSNNIYTNYFDNTSHNCYVTNGYETAPDCNAVGVGLSRMCACDYSYIKEKEAIFYFTYPTPAQF